MWCFYGLLTWVLLMFYIYFHTNGRCLLIASSLVNWNLVWCNLLHHLKRENNNEHVHDDDDPMWFPFDCRLYGIIFADNKCFSNARRMKKCSCLSFFFQPRKKEIITTLHNSIDCKNRWNMSRWHDLNGNKNEFHFKSDTCSIYISKINWR